jgi:hypothetical protein
MSEVQLREVQDALVDTACRIVHLQKDLDRERESLAAYSEMHSRVSRSPSGDRGRHHSRGGIRSRRVVLGAGPAVA